jgi:hypothetical protein
VVQVLVTISGVLKYAAKHGIKASVVSLRDLQIGREGKAERQSKLGNMGANRNGKSHK